MSTYTVIGDPHAKPDNLHHIELLFDIIEDLRHPCIILGDLLDTKELVRGKCINTYLRRLSESKLKFIILVGNHDFFNKECEDHSLQPLKLLSNVTVVDEPMEIDGMQFYPYMKEPPKLNTKKVIFGHFDIIGFDYGNGYISKDGMTADDFNGCSRVISGHYHKYQKTGNITYLGTPFSHSFGESNQSKYIGVYDTDRDILDLLHTPFPQHITHELDVTDMTLNVDPDNYNRVILSGPKELVDAATIDGVKVIKRYTQIEQVVRIAETQAPHAQFKEWGTNLRGLSTDVIDLGLEILRDVQ